MDYGLITHVTGDGDSRTILRETVRLAVAAEQAGFSSFWVAQHHLGSHRSHSSAPFVLLAAVAERTTRLRLGTAVAVLPLEDPLRLAEDAATLDALSGGRVELGVGAGADPQASAVFGRDHDRRQRATIEALRALCDELTRDRLVPSASSLRSRLWLATGTKEGTQAAVELELGVLSGRRSGPDPVEEQATAARLARYHDAVLAAGRQPRVGLSRAVFCARDLAQVTELTADNITRLIRDSPPGRFAPGYSAGDYLTDGRIMAGSPPEVQDKITADWCTEYATSFLANIPQAHPDLTDNLHSIELFGEQIIGAMQR